MILFDEKGMLTLQNVLPQSNNLSLFYWRQGGRTWWSLVQIPHTWRYQVITWTSGDLFPIRFLATNFREIWIILFHEIVFECVVSQCIQGSMW